MLKGTLSQHTLRIAFVLVWLVLILTGSAPPAEAQSAEEVEIAVALSLSGDGASYAQGGLEGIQLAIEEANASGLEPQIKLVSYDDQSSDEVGQEVAGQVVNSQALITLGPAFSTISIAAGPTYAAAGLISLPTSATSDLITQNPTTYQGVFKNSDQGEMLATYLVRVLNQHRAAVFVVDTAYGQTLHAGFQHTAERLGLEADYYIFTTEEEGEEMARQVAAAANPPPIVLLTLDPEGARLLTTLRRLGVTGPFLGDDVFGEASFYANYLADEPEEQDQPGYFSNNLYGLAPVILDSANADTLAFAERYQTRFGHEPTWSAVAGYDAANLAVAAIRAADPGANADIQTRRQAVLAYIQSLNGPDRALPGLLGPFWFDEGQARPQAVRVARFHGSRLESAPLQIVLVTTPDPAEIDSGAVFELRPGRYARTQRVVYTGIYLNEIPRVDLARSSFNADFYLWLRFTGEAGPGSADPTDLIFPNMVSGSFNREKPAEQRKMDDGAEYWLWRVQGEFRNDFDLHRFPFDRQDLSLSFFNARAPLERIVYVVDQRADTNESSDSIASGSDVVQAAEPTSANTLAIASPQAFRNLTQWQPFSAQSRRENLVTDSALGDPTRVGAESQRELSGFLITIEVERRALTTLIKSLLPLLLLTLILYTSLHFTVTMLVPKVVASILTLLSSIVLFTSLNAQLGGIGYTVAAEYVFYIYFILALLCLTSVFTAEGMRVAKRPEAALRIELWARIIFLVTVAVTLAGMVWLYLGR